MRRHENGIGCGARARGSQPRSREALGPALRPAWAGRAASMRGTTTAGKLRDRDERRGFAPRCPGHRPEAGEGGYSPRETAK